LNNSKAKKILTLLIFVIVAAVVAAVGIKNNLANSTNSVSSNAPVNRYAVTVDTAIAREDEITTTVNARGTAELIEKKVLYARTQGRISEVRAEVGADVNEGDVLIVYDEKALDTLRNQLDDARLALRSAQVALNLSNPPPTEAELAAARNSVTQAENSVKDAQSQIDQADLKISQLREDIASRLEDYRKVEQLYSQGVSPKRDLDSAFETLRQLKNQFDSAQSQRELYVAALQVAQGNVEYAQNQYELTQNRQNEPVNAGVTQQRQVQVEQASLRVSQLQKEMDDFITSETAPVSGVVLTLNAQTGGAVSTGIALMEIGDVSGSNMIIKVNVPENRASGIEIGEIVVISGDALGNKSYEGVVSKVSPKAEQKQIGTSIETVITVEVSILDESAPIKPGYTIEADIITRVNANAVVVPIMTLITESGQSTVYVVKGDNSVEKRYVELGSMSGMDVEVLSGVELGEKVVVTPPDNLADGSYVNESLGGVTSSQAEKSGVLSKASEWLNSR
jgi:HlyD family secretion protein